jgi:hypothetical protein
MCICYRKRRVSRADKVCHHREGSPPAVDRPLEWRRKYTLLTFFPDRGVHETQVPVELGPSIRLRLQASQHSVEHVGMRK